MSKIVDDDHQPQMPEGRSTWVHVVYKKDS